MAKCLYTRGAYVGNLFSWSLWDCKEIVTFSPRRSAAAPRTSAPLTPKIYTSPFEKAAWGISASPLWFNCWRRTASTASLLMWINELGLLCRVLALVGTAGPLILRCTLYPHSACARVTGYPGSSRAVCRDMPALHVRYGPIPASHRHSSRTLLLVTSPTAYAETRPNMHMLGPDITSPTKTWSRGVVTRGDGSSLTYLRTSLKHAAPHLFR